MNLQDVQAQINDIENMPDEKRNGLSKQERNRLIGRLAQLRIYRNYLETFPTKEFMEKEVNRLKNLLESINNGFEKWKSAGNANGKVEGQLQKYLSEMNVSHYKNQIKVLTDLLK